MSEETVRDEGSSSVTRPTPDREVTRPIPWAPSHTVRGPEASVDRYLETVVMQRVARTQWPEDGAKAMTALARLFPSMTRWKGDRPDTGTWIEPVPGTDPWDAMELVEWLNTSGEPTSGSRHAALFLLSVWNSEDWCAHGLRIPRRRKGDSPGSRRIGRFDLTDAFAAWDDQHRQAALVWMLNPFMP